MKESSKKVATFAWETVVRFTARVGTADQGTVWRQRKHITVSIHHHASACRVIKNRQQ